MSEPINGSSQEAAYSVAVADVQARMQSVLEHHDARVVLRAMLVNVAALAKPILDSKHLTVGDITAEFMSSLLDVMEHHSIEKPRIQLING